MKRAYKSAAVILLLTVILSLFMTPVATANDQECDRPAEEQVERINTVVNAVMADDFATLKSVTSAHWSTDEARGHFRVIALEALGAWMRASDELEIEEFCIDEQGRPTGYFHNKQTGMVDLVRYRIDKTDPDRIDDISVRTAVRPKTLPTVSSHETDKVEQLKSYLDMLGKDEKFSGVVLLARDGKPLLLESYGWASKELNIAMNEGRAFNLASLNKMFTAVAILQLVEQGQLNLDSRLGDLLPDEPMSEAAAEIEVQHLLSHTSGSISGLEALDFEPGTEYAYSNYGFYLLGEVIEVVSGLSYDDYYRLNLFGPAGMAKTANYALKDTHELVPGLVWGYGPDPDSDSLKFIPNPYLQYYPGGAMGGYYSTAGDLLRFTEALKAGELISQEMIELMRTPKPELGAAEYGFGTMLWRGPGIWGHAGDLPGADADLEFYGDTGLVAIVLGNFDENNPPVLMKIRSLFFPESLSAELL